MGFANKITDLQRAKIEKTKELEILNKWIHDCIYNNQWQDYDLHIDEIYGKTRKESWISGGFSLLETAKSIIDKSKFLVILEIPAKTTTTGNDDLVLFDSLSASDLSSTPPLLRIIEKTTNLVENFIK